MNPNSVLITAFFPGSIRYEGIRKVAIATYDRMLEVGMSPVILAPYSDDLSADIKYVYVLKSQVSLPRIIIAFVLYFKFLVYLFRVRKFYNEFYCIESNPSSPFTAIFLKIFCKSKDISVFFLSPIIGFKSFMDIFLRYKELQAPIHYLFGNKLLAKFFVSILSRMKCLYVGSSYQKSQLLNLGLGCEVIDTYGPIKIPVKKRNSKKDFVIGYLGHFSTVKGVDILIDGFKEIYKLGYDVRLSIAWSGKGNCSKRIRAMLALDDFPKDRLSMVGIVSPEEFFKSVDLIVLPYLIASVPIPPAVLYEALSSGTKVLIPDLPGLAGTLDKHCIFYRAENSDDMVIKILDYINE